MFYNILIAKFSVLISLLTPIRTRLRVLRTKQHMHTIVCIYNTFKWYIHIIALNSFNIDSLFCGYMMHFLMSMFQWTYARVHCMCMTQVWRIMQQQQNALQYICKYIFCTLCATWVYGVTCTLTTATVCILCERGTPAQIEFKT